jgi:hypothetical protein
MHEIRVIATEINVQTWGSNAMHMVLGGNCSNILFFSFRNEQHQNVSVSVDM